MVIVTLILKIVLTNEYLGKAFKSSEMIENLS